MAVTPATNVILLGIGTGNNRSLSSEFRPLVLTAQETAMVATLHATDANTAWFCLAFNAKEAAFKFMFPLVRKWIKIPLVRGGIDNED